MRKIYLFLLQDTLYPDYALYPSKTKALYSLEWFSLSCPEFLTFFSITFSKVEAQTIPKSKLSRHTCRELKTLSLSKGEKKLFGGLSELVLILPSSRSFTSQCFRKLFIFGSSSSFR